MMYVKKFRSVWKRIALVVFAIVMSTILLQAHNQLGSYESILAKLSPVDVDIAELSQSYGRKSTYKIRRNHLDDDVHNEKELTCGQGSVNWREKKMPKYKLNPDKLLIPTLYNGPNNQLAGFHQSVIVAILLNRFV